MGNEEGFNPEQEVIYNLPKEGERKENHAYLEGTWYNDKDYMELRSETGKIILKFEAKKVNIVAGNANENNPIAITVILDNQRETKKSYSVQDHTLYNIISLDSYGKHDIEIEAKKGLRIYTFTFG